MTVFRRPLQLKLLIVIDSFTRGCSWPRTDDPDQSSKDPVATHTKKRGQIHQGYQAHVASNKRAMVID